MIKKRVSLRIHYLQELFWIRYTDKILTVWGLTGHERAMLRKIRIEQLGPGMYVSQLDHSWLNIPLFRPRISTMEEVKTLARHGVMEVVIDTDKGLDVPETPAKTQPAGARPAGSKAPADAKLNQVDYLEEIAPANTVFEQTEASVFHVMEAVRQGSTPELSQARNAVERMIGSLLRNKDALTSLVSLRSHSESVFQHAVRVCVLALALAEHLGFSREDMRSLGMGALLHDVGKMHMSAHLLEKTAPFTAEEYQEYKRHALNGAKSLETSGIEKNALLVMLQHHERPDGSGFPQGLQDSQISDVAKMVAIADTFDNVLHKAQFQERTDPHMALKFMNNFSGTGLDGALLAAFNSALGVYPVGTLVRLSDHRTGIVLSVHHTPSLVPKVWVVFDANQRMLEKPVILDLAQQTGKQQVTIVGSVNPDKMGFDLEGYVNTQGLFSGKVHSQSA